jgi:DNA-binding transcriptional ArsR family regulator
MAARPRRAERSAASVPHGAGALEPRAVRPPRDQPGTSALPPVALDTVIHERLRLAIVSALAVNDRLSFNELKRLIDTTDGNLSVHGRKLESAGYVTCEKSFDGRVPKTEFRLTAAGRRALEKYLAHMEALIKAIKT